MRLVLSKSLNLALQKRAFSTTPSRFSSQYKVRLPLFSPGFEERFRDKVAFTDWQDRNFTYEQLTGKSLTVNNELKSAFKRDDKTRVSFLCPNDSSFLTTLWGIWMAGHTGVPLSSKHPDNLLEYFIKSSKSDVVVTTKEFADRLNTVTKAVGSELVVLDFDQLKQSELDKSYLNESNYVGDKDALILFTSGTTGLPKGVLLTHENLHAQIDNICTAWEINHNDSLLHTLPLHHTHGLIHALLSPLAVGGRVHMMAKFDAATLWSHLLSSDPVRVNLLMGVPTVYVKLVEEYDNTYGKKSRIEQEFVKATCEQKMRMMLSGSAALPIPVLEKFKVITGHTLLERYGMTEIGMALTNPLHGERKPGYVGNPFESVRVRIADLTSRTEYKTLAEGTKNRTDILEGKKDKVIGDLLVKGPSVFKCYFNNPEATAKEFTHDGWFITGDTVEYSQGSYKILGRKSVDIIKSGGYKLSALEIETQLLGLSEIKEVAVMALPDSTWGQKVAAVLVWNGPEKSLLEFKELAKSRVAPYACPTVIRTLPELPRNHLGKVNKKELVKIFEK